MKEIITKISQVTAEVTLFLRNLGFSNYYIIKIYDLVGDAAVSLTEDNPYWLLEEFPRIGFKKMDEVADKLGFDMGSPFRIQVAVRYILAAYVSEGHTYAPTDELVQKVAEMTELNSYLIRDVLEDMVFEGKIHMAKLDGTDVLYFYSYFRAECSVCGRLADMESPEKPLAIPENIEFFIRKSQQENGIVLTDEQVRAVKNSLLAGVSIITGGPGTGKTTVLRTLISILEEQGLKVAVAAPTGRAAKRIMESSGHFAQTVHRLLEYSYDEELDTMRFMRNADRPIEYNAVIVDETSMMDIMLAEALVNGVKQGTRLIFVGDCDQLPSVGAGNVLRDLIDSEYFFTSRLTEIHRQSGESSIVMNAHRINRGEYPEYAEDFELIRLDRQQDIADRIVEIAAKYKASDVQVLTPVKKKVLGQEELNVRLQEVFNPHDDGKDELQFGNRVFRVGDRVMQNKNNYQLGYKFFDSAEKTKKLNPMVSTEEGESTYDGKGVFNGEVGIVMAADKENKTLTVLYDDERWVTYPYTLFDELELSYAVTVHKSQGSEYPVVIIPVTWFPPVLATRSLIYTAITRGKEKVFVVGNPDYLNAMVDNDRSRERNSGLRSRLVALYQ